MSTRRATASAGPARVDFEPVQGGFDHRWTEWILDVDLSGSTVEVELRLENSTVGAADETLTDGNGLTIAVGGNAPATPPRTGNDDSSIEIVVPSSITATTNATELWYMLIIEDAGGVRLPYKVGKIPYSWKVIP